MDEKKGTESKSLLTRVHEIIGGMANDDLKRLKLSIDRDGVLAPVIIRKATGEIIDGQHRAILAKDDYPIRELDVDEREAARQAVVLNMARRHYSCEQKRELIKLLRKEGFTQQEVAEMVGVTQARVSQVDNINPYIPNLRIKLSKANREEIERRLQEGDAKKKLIWNEKEKTYEAPELAPPKKQPEPVHKEPPEQVDLRYKSGVKKQSIKEMAKVMKARKRAKLRKERAIDKMFAGIKKPEYWQGIRDAKKACREIYFQWKDFAEGRLKSLLKQVGAPKEVIKNIHKIGEVNIRISGIEWKVKVTSDDFLKDMQEFNGHILYIKDEDDIADEK